MNKINKQTIFFGAMLLVIGMILFWRCFYSVNTTDEAYYVGTVYRLWFGDGMLCDEWNPTQQMCSFWLYPFYVLFRMILGSNEGMILAFRLLYIVFQLLISIYMYSKLKKFGNIGFGATFFYLLSTAFNINSLSYNTMANGCLLAFLVTLATMEKQDYKNCIWCGIFASIVVMGNPYAVVAYVFYGMMCVGVTIISSRKDKKAPAALQFSSFIKMSLTAAVVLIVFLIFTFQNATLERIIKNLPYIVGDQEHVQRWGVKISDYFRYFKKYYLGCTMIPMIAAMIAAADKKRITHGKIYVGISLVSILPYIIYHGLISDYVPINFVTVPICFLGLPSYFTSDKKMKNVFYGWYLPAMFYPFIVQITSNTGPLAVSAAFVTAGAAAIVLAVNWASQQTKQWWMYLIRATVILQLFIMLFLRVTFVWADGPLKELTVKVERGAAKGLYTTEAAVQRYNEMYDDLDMLEMKEDDGLLVVGSEPLLYLYADKEVASYSTWQVFTNETRLYRYYEIHDGEGKFPSVVYCVDADETIFDSILVDKLLLPMGYEWKELQHGIGFYKSP